MIRPERGPCGNCSEEIDIEADECPHCGHSPKKQQFYIPAALIAIAAVISLTIVGLVVGIPLGFIGMAWILWIFYRGVDRTPVDDEWLARHNDERNL